MSGESPMQEELQKATSNLNYFTQKAEADYVSQAGEMEQYVNNAYNTAIGTINNYYGQALQAGEPYAEAGINAINTMQVNLSNPNQGMTNFIQSIPFQTLMTGYGATANTMPSNMTQAMATFENSPDYQFTLDQGLSAAERAQAIQGNIDDPSLQMQLQTVGSGIASQQYQNYVNNLNTAYNAYNTNLNQLATLGENETQTNQGLLANQGQNLAQLQTSQGLNIAQIQQGVGEVEANAQMALGNANASYNLMMAGAYSPAASATIGQDIASLSSMNSLPTLSSLGSVGAAGVA